MADPVNFTDTFLKNLKPKIVGEREAYADSQVPGLKVRFSAKGTKSLILWRRFPGNKQPVARLIGRVGEISLADARQTAREWIALARAGKDPAQVLADKEAQEQAQRATDAAKSEATFGKALARYYAAIAHQRQAKAVMADMDRDLLPFWRNKPIHEISRKDVKDRVREIAAGVGKKKPTVYQAHAALSNVRTFFNWARDEGDYGLEAVPTDGMRAEKIVGQKKKHRQRVLDDDEIFAIWRTALRTPYPLGPGYQVLLLTGSRLNEIMEADRQELNLAGTKLTIPPERFKSDASHFVQLAPITAEIFASLPRFNAGGYFFSRDGGLKPARIWTKDKQRLNRRMLLTLRALARSRGQAHADIQLKPFVIHDLRRTVRTRLSQLKVPREIAEMVVGHARKGLDRVYDQYEFQDEMREALIKWAELLSKISNAPFQSNVLSLRKTG